MVYGTARFSRIYSFLCRYACCCGFDHVKLRNYLEIVVVYFCRYAYFRRVLHDIRENVVTGIVAHFSRQFKKSQQQFLSIAI